MADPRYFIRADGRIKGPFGLPDLQRLIRRGLLLPEHEVSTDRTSWVEAGRYEALFPAPDAAMQAVRPTTAAPSPPTSSPSAVQSRYGAPAAAIPRRTVA